MLRAEENDLLVRAGAKSGMGGWLRRFWIPVVLVEDVRERDGTPVRVEVLGEKFVAFRDSDGRIGLLAAYCMHRRANLYWGRNEQCGLRCIYHGWKFDVEGNCVDIPNAPEGNKLRPNMSTRTFPTIEQGGMVWAYFGPRENMPKPHMAEIFNVPASHRYVSKIVVRGNWLQMMEGDVDSS